jgi:hypothetical protein
MRVVDQSFLDYLFIHLTLKSMKVMKLLKRAFVWYFEQASHSYTWLPTGTLPMGGVSSYT